MHYVSVTRTVVTQYVSVTRAVVTQDVSLTRTVVTQDVSVTRHAYFCHARKCHTFEVTEMNVSRFFATNIFPQSVEC